MSSTTLFQTLAIFSAYPTYYITKSLLITCRQTRWWMKLKITSTNNRHDDKLTNVDLKYTAFYSPLIRHKIRITYTLMNSKAYKLVPNFFPDYRIIGAQYPLVLLVINLRQETWLAMCTRLCRSIWIASQLILNVLSKTKPNLKCMH